MSRIQVLARNEYRLSQPAWSGAVYREPLGGRGAGTGEGGLDLTWGAGALPPELGGVTAVQAQ